MAAITFTAGQVLAQAFRLCGVLGQGESMDADMATDGLALLNGFLDRMQTQRLTLPASTRLTFAFTDGVSTYSIGPMTTWEVAQRPVSIDAAAVEAYTAILPYEMGMDALSDQSYSAIVQKTLRAPFPSAYYYNATAPLGSIFVWPTPTQSALYRMVLYVAIQLITFADLVTPVTLAPGYYDLILYAMASELALAWAVPASPVMDKIDARAQQALRDIKRNNLEMVDLSVPAALPGAGGVYNVYSDSSH
jgi:hypothetical protein